MRGVSKTVRLGFGLEVSWLPRWQVARGDAVGVTLHREWSDRWGVRLMLGPAGDVVIDWPKKARAA